MKRKSLVLALIVGLVGAPFPAYAEGVPPSSATDAQLQRAQALFLQGKSDLDAGRNEAALAAFRASYDTVASPNSHLFVARCLVNLGDFAAAHREYARVSEGAKQAALADAKYAATQTAADTERAELSSKLGFLLVRLENAGPEATITVGGAKVAYDALGEPIAVNPGLIEVSASSAESPAAHSIVMVGAGEQKELSLTLAPALADAYADGQEVAPEADSGSEDARKRTRMAAYVAGGIGAAGLVTFAIAGSMARSQYATLRDECGGPCPARQADIDVGRRSQTIANVGLAVGAVGLGAGTVLYLLSRPKSQDSTVGAAPLPPMTAEVAAGPSWLGVRGTFR